MKGTIEKGFRLNRSLYCDGLTWYLIECGSEIIENTETDIIEEDWKDLNKNLVHKLH